jgi:hypothetical protein
VFKCGRILHPSEVARITIQIQENELRTDISAQDKEAAVISLEEEHGLKPNEICSMFDRSPGWFSQIKGAFKFREKYGKLFEDAGVPLDTKTAVRIKKASKEQLTQFITELQKPEIVCVSKSALVKNLVESLSHDETRGRKKRVNESIVAMDSSYANTEKQADESDFIIKKNDGKAPLVGEENVWELNIKVLFSNEDMTFSIKTESHGYKESGPISMASENALSTVFNEAKYKRV